MRETLCVAEVPEALTLERNRDLVGRRHFVWVRRVWVAALVIFLALGLANAFGQRTATHATTAAGATLELTAPGRVRGGLLFQSRITIRAQRELKDARLVLDPGWAEGLQTNTVVPSPLGEASDNGRLSFDLGHVPAGSRYVLWFQFQVDPTYIGRRSQDVQLFDGDTYLLTHDHDLLVLP
jgi:hypothetical protein